jgi:hypothetical protein
MTFGEQPTFESAIFKKPTVSKSPEFDILFIISKMSHVGSHLI